MDNQKIIELIQNCLALSKSSNEHEASRAMEKAQDLLIKYNLDMASIEDKTVKGEDEATLINEVVDFDGPVTWGRTLLTVIANRNFCHSIKCAEGIHILGRKANVRAVVSMFNWLEPQIIRIAAKSPYVRMEKKSYILGMIHTIGQNLTANMEKHTATETRALIVTVQGEVDTWYKREYPHSSSSGRGLISEGAYTSGQRDGHTVSIFGDSRRVGQRILLT